MTKLLKTRLLATAILSTTIIAACTVPKPGERAETGECPEGETCSDATPTGIVFMGTGFFDDQTLRLGPLTVGGSLEVGLKTSEASEIPRYRVEIEDSDVLTSRRGEDTFGPLDAEGEPYYEVDSHIVLTSRAPGTTMLRVVDATTGELFDRLEMKTYEVVDVRLVNLNDPDREYLHAGEEELLGVRLIAQDGSTELRAIDQDLVFTAEGDVQPENMYWDCFTYVSPADVDDMTFTIQTSGQTFTRSMPVQAFAAP